MMAYWWLGIGVVVQCVCSMMEKHDTSRNFDPQRCNGRAGPGSEGSAVSGPSPRNSQVSSLQSSTLEASYKLCVVENLKIVCWMSWSFSSFFGAKECIHSVTLVALSKHLVIPGAWLRTKVKCPFLGGEAAGGLCYDELWEIPQKWRF